MRLWAVKTAFRSAIWAICRTRMGNFGTRVLHQAQFWSAAMGSGRSDLLHGQFVGAGSQQFGLRAAQAGMYQVGSQFGQGS